MNIKLNLYDLIVQSAKEGLEIQSEMGRFPKGHNGPHEDEDTYVRTTAHWALLLYKAYEITNNKKFLDKSILACNYLTMDKNRPEGYTFYCRKDTTGKNRSNGLIGQAWAVEPLIFIGEKEDNEEYLSIAKDVLSLHNYSFKKHAWNSLEVNGKNLGIRRIVNQQIWFGTMNLILGKTIENENLIKRARDFFNNFLEDIQYLDKGLISHISYRPTSYKSKVWNKIKNIYFNSRAKKNDKKIKLISLGYLPFILYGLSLAYNHSKQEKFWKGERLKKTIKNSIEFVLSNHPYGYLRNFGYRWRYNPTGIEMAYTFETQKDFLDLSFETEKIIEWLKMQIKGYYSFDHNLMIRNTNDPEILSSRLYEATRLKNYKFKIDKQNLPYITDIQKKIYG